jgi:hypothetical protein
MDWLRSHQERFCQGRNNSFYKHEQKILEREWGHPAEYGERFLPHTMLRYGHTLQLVYLIGMMKNYLRLASLVDTVAAILHLSIKYRKNQGDY